jgi:hypothetical protein
MCYNAIVRAKTLAERDAENGGGLAFMDMKIIGGVAVINSETPIVTGAQAALDLIVSAYYEHNANKMAISKAAVSEDFFRLSTGLAGEIAQKFVNYRFRLAIFGDFSGYTSKPLRDYMYECNKGNCLCFAADEAEALQMLSK